MPKQKVKKMSLIYDKRQKDFVVKYPNPEDGRLVFYHFGDILRFDLEKWGKGKIPYETYNFKKELEKRGYDLSTLKFSIELKK